MDEAQIVEEPKPEPNPEHIEKVYRERRLGAIQGEYTALCAQIGEREYRVRVLQNELAEHYKKALELNQEASKLKGTV